MRQRHRAHALGSRLSASASVSALGLGSRLSASVGLALCGSILRERARFSLFVHCACGLKQPMGRKSGMLPYTVEVTDDDGAVTAYAGLPLVVETMRTLGVSAE